MIAQSKKNWNKMLRDKIKIKTEKIIKKQQSREWIYICYKTKQNKIKWKRMKLKKIQNKERAKEKGS